MSINIKEVSLPVKSDMDWIPGEMLLRSLEYNKRLDDLDKLDENIEKMIEDLLKIDYMTQSLTDIEKLKKSLKNDRYNYCKDLYTLMTQRKGLVNELTNCAVNQIKQLRQEIVNEQERILDTTKAPAGSLNFEMFDSIKSLRRRIESISGFSSACNLQHSISLCDKAAASAKIKLEYYVFGDTKELEFDF